MQKKSFKKVTSSGETIGNLSKSSLKLSCLNCFGIACKILIHALLILAESLAQAGQHQTEMEEVSISIPTGGNFFRIFCHPLRGKPLMQTLLTHYKE